MTDWARGIALLVSTTLLLAAVPAGTQDRPDLATERRVVEYLRQHIKPGERLVVSDLYNNVFTQPDERKVLDRLFNTFFKIPLFVAQYRASTSRIPTLDDIARQFNLPIPGEAAVLLTIIENDPRVPKFIKRDPATGEITEIDVEAVRKNPRFGQVLERTLAGWAGRTAPPFVIDLFDGSSLNSDSLKGKPYLLYFWFSGCPPCVRVSPHLVQLQNRYRDRGFTVVAANADRVLELDTSDAERAAYVKKTGYNFPVGHMNRNLQESYGNVNVYPTFFLVGADGIIQKHYVNYQPFEVFDKDLEPLLKEGSPE